MVDFCFKVLNLQRSPIRTIIVASSFFPCSISSPVFVRITYVSTPPPLSSLRLLVRLSPRYVSHLVRDQRKKLKPNYWSTVDVCSIWLSKTATSLILLAADGGGRLQVLSTVLLSVQWRACWTHVCPTPQGRHLVRTFCQETKERLGEKRILRLFGSALGIFSTLARKRSSIQG